MKLDTHDEIGAAFANASEMRQAMVQISQHVQDRAEHQEWVDHLRFLTAQRTSDPVDSPRLPAEEEAPSAPSTPTSDSSSIGDPCSCNALPLEPFSSFDRHLRLTLPSDTPECTHFVAVSYCWSSTAKAPFRGQEPFVLHLADGSTRPPKCPPSLLERVVQFASWKQCSFIWIDQECIDQNDRLDQTVGIQSMDLVYERAEYCLAVLEARVTSQRHLDGLATLLENDGSVKDEGVWKDVCDGLRTIMNDPWFERAWCLQESVSGNRQMTLLVRHGKGLEIPGLMESQVEGCFELDLQALHHGLVSFQPRIGEPSVSAEYQRINDDWFENMASDFNGEYGAGSRTVCNGAQALCFLERRKNLVPSDRVAIMANLCGYDRRLNSLALDNAGYDFSICAFVLAVINGDFTVFSGFYDAIQTGTSGRRSHLLPAQLLGTDNPVERPFTWSLGKSARLARLSYFDHGAQPVRLIVDASSLNEGLRIKGSVWEVDRLVDLASFARSFKDSWPSDLTSDDRLNSDWDEMIGNPDLSFDRVRIDFLQRLLCELADSGFDQIVDLLWEQFRLHPTTRQKKESDETTRYSRASFAEVVDIETRLIKWPSPMKSHLTTIPGKIGQPFAGMNRADIQFLMQTALIKHRILLARTMRSGNETPRYAAIFEGVDIGNSVLVPSGLSGMPYGWYPHSWVVDPQRFNVVEKPSGILCIRPVCGMWQIKHVTEDYVLVQ